MKYLYQPEGMAGKLALDPATMEAIVNLQGQVCRWRQRVDGQPPRYFSADEIEQVLDDGEVFVPNSPYPIQTVGLSEAQRAEVKAMLAEHDREMVRRIQGADIFARGKPLFPVPIDSREAH